MKETHRAMMYRTNREYAGTNHRGFKRFLREQGQMDLLMHAHNSGMHDAHFGEPCKPPYPAHAKRRRQAYMDAYAAEQRQRDEERSERRARA